jgi:hypothetical protein
MPTIATEPPKTVAGSFVIRFVDHAVITSTVVSIPSQKFMPCHICLSSLPNGSRPLEAVVIAAFASFMSPS